MKRQKREEVHITAYLRVEHTQGEAPPDIRALFASLLQHPYITNSIVWGIPTWKDILPPWSELSDSPFEPGDTVIHVCQIDSIKRTLLANYNGYTASYLPYADEEVIERAVYEHLKANYPYLICGFYPCPQHIKEVYQALTQTLSSSI